MVPAALNFRLFAVLGCFLPQVFVLPLIWAVMVPDLPTLLLAEPSAAARAAALSSARLSDASGKTFLRTLPAVVLLWSMR